MTPIDFSRPNAQPIDLFSSANAASVRIADGEGESYVHCVYLEADSVIGRHTTGFAQLFLVLEGEAWASGEDGNQLKLSAGQGVHFAKGENHSKGSDLGATVIMVQAGRFALTETGGPCDAESGRSDSPSRAASE